MLYNGTCWSQFLCEFFSDFFSFQESTILVEDINNKTNTAEQNFGNMEVQVLLIPEKILEGITRVTDFHLQQWKSKKNNNECVILRWSEKNLPSGRHKKITSFWGLPGAPWTNAITVESNHMHSLHPRGRHLRAPSRPAALHYDTPSASAWRSVRGSALSPSKGRLVIFGQL